MRFPLSILACITLFHTTSLVAQPTREVPAGRTITVNGEAEVRVVPDEAVFNFGIETSSMDMQEARAENDKRLRELLALATRLGIASQHVQTDYLDIEPRYEYENDEKRRKFIGYFTTRNVAITLKDLRLFDDLLTGALKLGVTGVGQAQFRTSELRKHRDQARLMAVRAAKEKAIDMSKELGSTIGKPISISEASVWEDNWYGGRRGGRMMMQNAMMDAPSSDGGGSSIIAPGQIAVSARVTVIFELQ